MQSIASTDTGRAPSPGNRSGATPDPTPSLEAVELELAIDSTTLDRDGFVAAVRLAADGLGADYLFDLPASGLAANCQRIAVLRLTPKGRPELMLLVKLADDGQTISVAEPDAETAGLADFAKAFVNVLSRL